MNAIYFFIDPEDAILYAYEHREGGDQDTIFSLLPGGEPVLVVVKVDDWIERRLEEGWQYDPGFEWIVKGGFVPAKNIVQVFRLPKHSSDSVNLKGLLRWDWKGYLKNYEASLT